MATPTYKSGEGQVNTISEPFTINGITYRTETVATLKDGKVIAGSEVRLQKAVQGRSGTDYSTTAVSRDGGKSWFTPGTGRGTDENKPISTSNTTLTAEEIKALQPGGNLNKQTLNSANLSVKKGGATEVQAVASTSGKEEPNPLSAVSEITTITQVDLSDQLTGTGKQRDKSGSFGDYRYPEGLQNTTQDVIKFTMLKYIPQSITSKDKFESGDLAAFNSSKRNEQRESLGTVILPIPSGISETNGVNWSGQEMTPFQGLAANVALTSIQKGLKAGAGQVGGIMEGGAGGANPDLKTAVAYPFSEAVTNVGNLLSRTQGAIFNPNLELLFSGPTLRPFGFTFKMSARSKPEAQQILKIIRFFKQGMSAQKTQSSLFLKAPHTFRIQYLYRQGEEDINHPYIGQIKECALQNFTVNYTPEGQYATFGDGVMVSYEIQMQFQELEPVFNEDYGNFGNLPANLTFQ